MWLLRAGLEPGKRSLAPQPFGRGGLAAVFVTRILAAAISFEPKTARKSRFHAGSEVISSSHSARLAVHKRGCGG